MQIALGRSAEDEYRHDLHKLADAMDGNWGLLFTDKEQAEVLEYFAGLSESDFARAGAQATDAVTMDEGPLNTMPPNMLESLRNLGMPVRLVKGTVMLESDFTVCKEKAYLTPAQAQILKLFSIEMAEFQVRITAMWTDDTFTPIEQDEE